MLMTVLAQAGCGPCNRVRANALATAPGTLQQPAPRGGNAGAAAPLRVVRRGRPPSSCTFNHSDGSRCRKPLWPEAGSQARCEEHAGAGADTAPAAPPRSRRRVARTDSDDEEFVCAADQLSLPQIAETLARSGSARGKRPRPCYAPEAEEVITDPLCETPGCPWYQAVNRGHYLGRCRVHLPMKEPKTTEASELRLAVPPVATTIPEAPAEAPPAAAPPVGAPAAAPPASPPPNEEPAAQRPAVEAPAGPPAVAPAPPAPPEPVPAAAGTFDGNLVVRCASADPGHCALCATTCEAPQRGLQAAPHRSTQGAVKAEGRAGAAAEAAVNNAQPTAARMAKLPGGRILFVLNSDEELVEAAGG